MAQVMNFIEVMEENSMPSHEAYPPRSAGTPPTEPHKEVQMFLTQRESAYRKMKD